MNTPAHAIINLLILSRNPTQKKTVAIISGAVIPDLVIIVFYAWHLLIGTAEQQIWSVEYYNPVWQAWIDSFNSIPVFLIAALICWKTKSYLLLAFFCSLLLHSFGDLPLHHDDAHRHFFPFLEWRFISPVSYWNPDYHGQWIAILEFLAVLGASIYLWIRHAVLRIWVYALLAIYLIYWIYVIQVWS